MTSEQPTPTAIAELIERLEICAISPANGICSEAAQTIRTLAAENERMREALLAGV